jgi:hypothetical protein
MYLLTWAHWHCMTWMLIWLSVFPHKSLHKLLKSHIHCSASILQENQSDTNMWNFIDSIQQHMALPQILRKLCENITNISEGSCESIMNQLTAIGWQCICIVVCVFVCKSGIYGPVAWIQTELYQDIVETSSIWLLVISSDLIYLYHLMPHTIHVIHIAL